MKQLISAFTLIVLLFTACHKPEPEPAPQPKPTTKPAIGNSFKVEFKATPEVFPADGGKGIIEGILKEVSPEGKVVKKSPIGMRDFTLSLKSGDASQIQINEETKEVTIAKGIEEATFSLVAQMKKDKALSQELTLKREKGEAPKPQILTPLNFVAEYDINPDGNAFVDSYASNVAGYFNFDEAVKRFSDISIDGKKYHLPSKEEWLAIVPKYKGKYSGEDYVNFYYSIVSDNVEEHVIVGGEEVASTNDYRGNINKISYALRFKGTKWVSAWRYEYTMLGKDRVLKIVCRAIPETDITTTIVDISKEDYWQSNSEKDVVRYFPAAGFTCNGAVYAEKEGGSFWSSTQDGATYGWFMYFIESEAKVYSSDSNTFGRTIRLFISDL